MDTVTVGELVHLLQQCPKAAPVECWLPGQHLAITAVVPLRLIFSGEEFAVFLECRSSNLELAGPPDMGTT
jgi:hypothetical protein